MRRILVLVFFSVVAWQSFAEDATTWYSGSIVLATDEVLTGEISAQPVHDLVLFKKGEAIVVYPAHRISLVYFYDAAANINRKFISVKDDHPVFRIHHLYEIVLYGEISVLRKQKKHARGQHGEPSDKFEFDYYVKVNEGLTLLMHFRSKIYPELVKASGGQIVSFIHDNKLDPNLAGHAIRIIEFYNKGVKGNLFSTDLKLFQASR